MSADQNNGATPELIEELQQAIARCAQSADGSYVKLDPAVERCKKRAMRLLNHRARTVVELRGRLGEKHDTPEHIIDEVINDLIEAGLLNDAWFASEWVRQRSTKYGKSSTLLRRELREKGIADRDIESALEQLTEEDEFAMATQLAEKKMRQVSEVPDYPQRQKYLRRCVSMLARRGYPDYMALQVSIAALERRVEQL